MMPLGFLLPPVPPSITQASTVRPLLFAVLALVSQSILAEELAQRPAALLQILRSEGLHPTEPVFAESVAGASAQPYLAALVEKTAGAMHLVLIHRAGPGQFQVVTRSGAIGGLRGANFGFGIESFRFNGPDRLELALSARTSCARALYTHRFALRHGQWLVTGLDVQTPRCTNGGIDVDWTESANYLSGITSRTTFTRTGAPRTTSTPAARRPFPVAQFPPPGPEGIYREMQP